MKKIVINGNRPLKGEVTISGAKNSVVALIPAAILADSPVTLDGVPDIQDVHSLIEILEIMGAKITFENNTLIIDPTEVVSVPMPKGKINSLRASYYFMGSLLGSIRRSCNQRTWGDVLENRRSWLTRNTNFYGYGIYWCYNQCHVSRS